jgi:Rieske Fe-S protein
MSRRRSELNRRRFLLGAAALAAPACGGIVRGPASSDDDGGGGTRADAGDAAAPTPDAAPVVTVDAAAEVGAVEGGSPCASGTLLAVLPWSMYPELAQPGGSAQIMGNGYSDPECGLANIIVVTPTAGQYAALSGSCTIACCILYYDGTNLVCPCHDGSFNLQGQHNGTAAPPLQVLNVCADENAVYVSL